MIQLEDIYQVVPLPNHQNDVFAWMEIQTPIFHLSKVRKSDSKDQGAGNR